MSPLANPVKNNTAALLHPGVLLACGLGFASLIAPPARAGNQYCTNSSSIASCRFIVPFNSASDTYFWSPVWPTGTQPALSTLDLKKIQPLPLYTVRRLTLRGSSNVPLNAIGTTGAEVLIGSLGTNSLRGGGGGDTYVIGNTYAQISNLPACDPRKTEDCVDSQNVASFENDTVELSGSSTEVIYIDRCLQVTANGTPGLGGNMIGGATKARAADANWGPISDQTGNCPTSVASISNQTLRNLALGSHADLQAPWQRWWPASTAWNQAIGWLQQTITALIQGPHAVAQPVVQGMGQPLGKPQFIGREGVIKHLTPSNQSKVPSYPGVARLIQSSEGNFLKDTGDKIVVDGSTRTFNGQPLSSISKVSKVYSQRNNKDEIPLNQGIALVYHQQLGILASYGTDRYPYGTRENPGTVIAQLVQPDGRAQPGGSIDFVVMENLLTRSCETAPARKQAGAVNPLRP